MSNFNVGDVVVRKAGHIDKHSLYKCRTGQPVKIESITNSGVVNFSAEDGGDDWFIEYFELYQPPFDLKTMPWKIVVKSPEESRMAQEWLRKNDLNWLCGGEISNLDSPVLTNCTKGTLYAEACYMHSHTDDGRDIAPEIKLTFGVRQVTYPEVPVKETEVEKKLRDLEEQQRKIADDIAKLRESM